MTVSTDNLQLSGKSLNYKIPLSSIQNLFLLPDTNNVQYYFVMELDAPIKRGKTEYKLFVFTLSSRVSLIQELYLNQLVLLFIHESVSNYQSNWIAIYYS